MKAAKPPKKPFSDKLVVCVPSHFQPMIERAAGRRLSTASEYVRQAVITRLLVDGIDPATDGVEA